MSEVKTKKIKVAWGITGAGDKIAEVVETMKDLQKQTGGAVEFDVYLSKAADTMLKFYRLDGEVRQSFSKVWVEQDANSPFLAGVVQSHKYAFLLIMPASSNTVAKIVNSISDTLLTNAALMSLKAFVPVWIMPVDFKENIIYTKLPNGKDLKLRVRKEEADQVRRLQATEDVYVFEDPSAVKVAFLDWYRQVKP
ncbi:MAG: archaeoflavoprotein AfpA [Crenarchaeota archaeon]|nr:archaeoflavoprotein AfpA [Thermoproteota archaeon]